MMGILVCVLVLVGAVPAIAQEELPTTEQEQLAAWNAYLESLDWAEAGATGRMGKQAEILVPAGYVFTGTDGTQSLMEAFGNLLSDREVGFVAPTRKQGQSDFPWFAVFEFDPVGYVKDDEKEDLDPGAMMKSMIDNQGPANEQREKMGYEPLYVTGWAIEPKYNEYTNNLEWAINLRTDRGEENVNLNTRILGREGVMRITLVCDPADLMATIPEYQRMLNDFRFQDGRRYAEFREGDKLAKIGLTGLVVGGGAAVLAKTGLLKKLLKPILIGLVAIGAFLKRIFGGKKSEPEE